MPWAGREHGAMTCVQTTSGCLKIESEVMRRTSQLSWPGLSRPSRLGRHRALLSVMRGSSPRMTAERGMQANWTAFALAFGPLEVGRDLGGIVGK